MELSSSVSSRHPRRCSRRRIVLGSWLLLTAATVCSPSSTFAQGQPVAPALPAPTSVRAPTVPAATGESIDKESARERSLQAGLELEQAQQWGDAIDHYDSATRAFPEDRILYQRLLISRLHFDVIRRYDDRTYLASVREMSSSQTLDLYSEILANLQTHYVDTIEWSRILLHGTAALEVALTEPAFVNRVVDADRRDRIESFRQAIHHRIAERSTQSRFDLRSTVKLVATMAHEELGISGTATVLEYVSGAVSTLDTYTRLLSPGQLDEMFSTIEGNFVGLGVELKAAEDSLLILSVIPGGPAAEAGIVPGDRILAVGGSRADEQEPNYVADLLRGPEGTAATLTIASADQVERQLSVTRRRVDVPCVENVHIVDSARHIGYFRLTNFQKSTPREVEQALWKLHRAGMRSLIMDLRDNPGGLLSAAVEVADRFLSDGRIVTTRGRNARENFDYTARQSNTWDVPMVVLIDRNSASASEIFSGAIHDSERGAIIGETSYGKGSVQGIFRMQSGKFGLCLTTAKFYSPSGKAISRNGVEPNVVVPPTYIAARPDKNGRVTTELDDAVLQKAIEHLGGGSR
ncbi:S41 family peptidase [Allorhodopirellula solitaria]|uniref:Putative CtpA-like serine protease n=1 Tax=Allorhodopirellula solitaria TaxID=2527987 RepID=A0A5C5YCQ3_9BACT|nr:S41 family peptidase [Allorhodopirellula solitaria]TWT72874.1 putative CtpA-like serine protease [Allorhodopirellula solitaria]